MKNENKRFAVLFSLFVLVVSLLIPKNNIQVVNADVIKTPLDHWIDQLELKELDFSYPRNHCIIDVDGVEVCGCLQYKKTTFLDDLKRYSNNLYILTSSTLDTLYTDCDFQKKLAKKTLTVNKNAWTRWKTSVITRGLGLPPVE